MKSIGLLMTIEVAGTNPNATLGPNSSKSQLKWGITQLVPTITKI
jgi:hypothetical protein